MPEPAIFSLWLMPGGDIANRLREQIIELSVEHQTPEFSPHVTLLGKLTSPKEKLIQYTEALASSLEPFVLDLTEADYLDRFYQSLFIQADKSKKLKEIRSSACRIFNVSEGDYMPHLSLLYGDVSQEEKELTLDTIGHEFHLQLPIKYLVLMQTKGEPNQWKEIYSVSL